MQRILRIPFIQLYIIVKNKLFFSFFNNLHFRATSILEQFPVWNIEDSVSKLLTIAREAGINLGYGVSSLQRYT